MQSTDSSALARKYENFHNPTIKVMADGAELLTKNEIYLERAEVTASVGREPDMAVLVYRVYKLPEGSSAGLEKYLALGQKMELQAGYGEDITRIFLGYLHEVDVSDSMEEYVEYTLICLDVKGLMRKNSVFQTSGTGKTQQVLEDIVGSACYGALVEKKEIAALPGSLNLDCSIRGRTHYDWLCSLAEYLGYEFYCGRGTLVFDRARAADGETVELDREYGLQQVKTVVSMAEQTGNIRMYGYNRKDEKLAGSAVWPGMQGPFGGKLKRTLQGCTLEIWDMNLETGEQMNQRAQALMDQMAADCCRMEAVNIGLPELRPGCRVKLTNGKMTSLSGIFYVEEVRQLLDQNGYRTIAGGPRVG